MSFDYSTVWTPTLRSAKVIVHLPLFWPDARERTVSNSDGGTRREVLVACGRRVVYTVDYSPEGKVLADYVSGTYIANGHAQTLGAHYCGNCWRDR